MEDSDFKLLELFYRHEIMKQSEFTSLYHSEVDNYGQTTQGLIDSISKLRRAKFLDTKTIQNSSCYLITEAGKSKYISEKQKRESENEVKSLGIEKLTQDVSLGRKIKRIWWLPYVISLGAFIVATASYVSGRIDRGQSVTKQEIQERLELNKQSVLYAVDSLYQKDHNEEFGVKKKVLELPPSPKGK